MILLVDNFDSFAHNLARYLQRLHQEVHVVRNDAVDERLVRAWKPQALVISPGPGTPQQAGQCLPLIRAFAGRIPILGVCLGHQALAAAAGARVVRAERPVHGQSSLVEHDGCGIFEGLPNPLQVGRYHSLVVDPTSIPAWLQVSARLPDGSVMGLRLVTPSGWERSREHVIRDTKGDDPPSTFAPAVGVQFHPESVLTEHGYQLLANFLRLAGLGDPPDVPTLESECPARKVVPLPLPTAPVTF